MMSIQLNTRKVTDPSAFGNNGLVGILRSFFEQHASDTRCSQPQRTWHHYPLCLSFRRPRRPITNDSARRCFARRRSGHARRRG